ncbi:LADA_0B05116g1_1 [Lachancea dasiensis]|uniref:LADA_0B05116g1_1 n=1 Tax=Lachancea dasiensis TaxID=1072105 RepID=A0A1G4ITA8_9SACH|nr:LADA_0B05116g1_1 [Lachancea dasiensis]
MSSAIAERLTKVLIAQYLSKKNYDGTLQHFLKEAGLGRSVLELGREVFEDIETIVSERIEFNEHQITARLAQTSLNDSIDAVGQRFYLPSWDHTLQLQALQFSLRPRALAVDLQLSEDSRLTISTADKHVYFYNGDQDLQREMTLKSGVVRRCGALPNRAATLYYYTCGMDGTLTIYNDAFQVRLQHKIHSRIVKNIEFFQMGPKPQYLCFSVGLDNYLKVHFIDIESFEVSFQDERKFQSACTSFQLAKNVEQQPVLLFTQQDHSLLYAVVWHEGALVEYCKLALNSAKFSSHAFNVLSSCLLDLKPPTDNSSNASNHHLVTLQEGSIVAIATSHTPYMRLVLLEVPEISITDFQTGSGTKIHYDKIIRNIATSVPQDSFSQSIIKSCHRSRGVLVGSDSGIYAIDVSNCDSWPLLKNTQRVKALDSLHDRIAVGFADRTIELLQWYPST